MLTMVGHVTKERNSRRSCLLLEIKNCKMVESTVVNRTGAHNVVVGGRFHAGPDEHRLTVEELCTKLETDSCFGLSQTAAESRLARDGKNVIFPSRKGEDVSHFLSRMFCGVSLLFWVTALNCIICFVVLDVFKSEKNYSILFVCIFCILYAILVGVIFYVQTQNESFSDTIPNVSHRIEVIRDGVRKNIPAEDVVVGDLVMLKFGEEIPADIRIIECQNFKVENHTLMGMTEPQQLNEKPNEGNPMESSNVALFSGSVVEGTARGIVIRTGKRTLLGQIMGTRKMRDILICPIVKKIIDCSNWIALFAAIFAVLLCGVFLLATDGQRLIDAFIVAAAVIVGSIPETLFPATLIVLHIFGRKMLMKDCKMKNIRAIQRLPFVETIFLDKPGVLTFNKAFVSNLWFDRRRVEVWGGTKVPLKVRSSPTFRELALCAILCSEARFSQADDNIPIAKRDIIGNPCDVAILKFLAVTVGKKIDGMREAYPKLFWGSYTKFQLSVHRVEDELLIILIGEPEFLLEKCVKYVMVGTNDSINDEFIQLLDKACVQFAKNGESLKCVIERKIRLEKRSFDMHKFKLPESGYTFLGMLGLSDYTRPNIAQTVAKCREAGIKVILTTSDHPITAKTFARSIGVITEESTTAEEKMEVNGESDKQVNAIVIDGMHSDKLSKKGMEKLLAKYSEVVFARASTIQKLMLLETCQQDNSIVAYVGDGVHDALTMKKADLSITLSGGRNDGTEAAADVCLPDETFYSLATCIEEGRTIYENLKKSSAYLLAGVVPTVIPMVAYCILGIPLPVDVCCFAIVKFILELFPAVALMFQKPDPGTMRRPPRKLSDPIWSRQMFFYSCAQIGLIETFACFYAYFVIMLEYGWTPSRLIGVRDEWDSKSVTDFEDIYGQIWSYKSRQQLETSSQTGYFYAFVAVQCAYILGCRHQWASLFMQRERNWMIHFSLLLKISCTFLMIYVSRLNFFMKLEPLKAAWWVLPLPYFCLIILYDEMKKYVIRKYPKGWLARETVY